MSKGKLLRFRRPKTSDTNRLRFLRLVCDVEPASGHFSVTTPGAEYRFYLDINGDVEECFGIYQDDEGVTMLEEEDFEDSAKKIILDVLTEAKEVLQSQLETWGKLQVSDKLKLQITWSEDLISELELRLREFVSSQSPREHCDFLQDLLREIECIDHYRMGLHSALLVL